MALPSYDDTTAQPQDEVKGKDTSLPAYRYAKTLVSAARGAVDGRAKNFRTNWDKFLGRYNALSPASREARQLAAWMFQGIVNWIFATIKTKSSIILGSSTEIHVDALDDESTYYDRLLVKSAEDHLLKSVRFDDVKRDAYISGSVTGIGVSMWQYRPDPITGAYKLVLIPVKSEEFAADPTVDCITTPDCRYVVWSTDMPMSRAREIFTGKAKDIKPDVSNVQDRTTSVTYTVPGDSNLIYGEGQSASPDPGRNAATRKAKIHFVWVRDESLIEELQEVLVSEARPGLWCATCAATYELDVPMDNCPTCDSPLENVTIPPKMRTDTIQAKAYPYGRLIVYSGDTLLFDGQNPCELESIFPFAVYHHDRVPGEFLGSNDVELLSSLQDAQDTSIRELVHYVRLGVNAPILYPSEYKAITELGNGPNQKLPGPNRLPWQPFRLSVQGFDIQSWQALINAIKEQFAIVGGLGDVGFSQTSSPPISATEAEIANARLSDRMKGHAREFAAYCSDVAEIGRQLAVQFYDEAQTVRVAFPDNTTKDLQVEWQSLPNVRVRVSVNPQETLRDKQVGQNISIGIQSGILDSPYAKLYLELVGASANQVNNVMDEKALAEELKASVPQPPPPPLGLVQGGEGNVPNA